MNQNLSEAQEMISRIPPQAWKPELEKASLRYHLMAAWAAIIFDPVFAITDYINIPESWRSLFVIRLSISAIILVLLALRKRFNLPSYFIIAVTFFSISIQNAYTYSLIGNDNLLGHNLNYIALLVGAGMFVLWEWTYSVVVIQVSIFATLLFIRGNPNLDVHQFFVDGGLLLASVSVFMIVLIQTRYNLSVREIKARLALNASNKEIQSKVEEIRRINENLEVLVKERTKELEKKNLALEEYAFINAHKLRSPLATILGLVNLIKKVELNDEAKVLAKHLEESADKLDDIVGSINKAIQRGDRSFPSL